MVLTKKTHAAVPVEQLIFLKMRKKFLLPFWWYCCQVKNTSS
jgi:hypothetical protein